MQHQGDQEGNRRHYRHVPVEGILHSYRFKRQRDVFSRTAEQRVCYRIGQAHAQRANLCRNISAFRIPLMEV